MDTETHNVKLQWGAHTTVTKNGDFSGDHFSHSSIAKVFKQIFLGNIQPFIVQIISVQLGTDNFRFLEQVRL